MNGTWSITMSGYDRVIENYIFYSSLQINLSNKTLVIMDDDYNEVGFRGSFTINQQEKTITCGINYVRFGPSSKSYYVMVNGSRVY